MILAVIALTFNPTLETAIPTGTPTNEANAEIGTQPLTAKMLFKVLHTFLCFQLVR